MNSFQAIKRLSSIIHDPSLIENARIYPFSFNRDRKITLDKLLDYLIFRNKNVLSQDIASFFSAVNDFVFPTKQAMIKRINLLNFDVWDEIMDKFRNEIYFNLKLEKIKDYIIISFDGSFLNLPSHYVLNQYFGGHITKKMEIKDIVTPQSKVSMAYDVLNKLILDFSIAHYKTSEIPLMIDHLKKLLPLLKGKKVIFLADRYYGSAEFFKFCEIHGFNYIVRAKKNFFKKEITKHEDDEKDFWINIHFDKPWIKRLKNESIKKEIIIDPYLDVRVVKGTYKYYETYKNKKKEIMVDSSYFTNLSENEFNTQDIIDLYHFERWNIETAYDTLKNDLDIEQFNTHNPIGIKNEVMGKVIFYNIEKIIYMESRNKIQVKDDAKYEYIPNNKFLINILHTEEFIHAFVKGIKKKVIKKIILASASEKIPIRKGRHHKRWGKYYNSIPKNKHRIDGRKNPYVSVTKVGIITCNH